MMPTSPRRFAVSAQRVSALVLAVGLALLAANCAGGRRCRFPRRGLVERLENREVVSGQILIKFRTPDKWRNEKDQEARITQIAKQSVSSEAIGTSDLILVECPDDEPLASFIQKFKQDPEVEFAEPDAIVPLKDCPLCSMSGGPYLSQQWGAAKIGACDAWGLKPERDKVVVAVIDSGIAVINGSIHEDLKDRIWLPPAALKVTLNHEVVSPPPGAIGFDATLSSSDDNDKKWQPVATSSHGTSVAGIIAGNGVGIRGISDGSKILVIKYTNGGDGCISSIVRAIDFIIQAAAQDSRIRIVNCSFGMDVDSLPIYGDPTALRDAFNRLNHANLLIVAAAADNGDLSSDHPHLPSSFPYPNLIAVTSTDCDDKLYSASYDEHQENLIAAPGKGIYAPELDRPLYGTQDGTSFAAAFVSGAAARVLSYTEHGCDKLTAPQLRDLLLKKADSAPSLLHQIKNERRLNVFNAMMNCHQ